MYRNWLLVLFVCLTALTGCHWKRKNGERSIVLLEAKRAEIVFTNAEKSEGELTLKCVSPAVARLYKGEQRRVTHSGVVDLIDDWYRKSAKKGIHISHGGFIFFEATKGQMLTDVALKLSAPRYDSDQQSLTFHVAFESKAGPLCQSVIQGVRLYIDR